MRRALAGIVVALAVGGCSGDDAPVAAPGAPIEEVLPFAPATSTTAATSTTTVEVPAAPTTTATTPTPPPTRALTPAPAASAGPFRNCTAAWDAGAAPVRRGDPGYGSHLDRDDDGVGCEVDPR